MKRFTSVVPRISFAIALALTAVTLVPQPAGAQVREQMKNRIVDDVANQMVAEIQQDSCPQFESFLKSRKSGGSGGAGGMMKKDPAMRQRFINKVAGPLVNKMIDCDLLPSK